MKNWCKNLKILWKNLKYFRKIIIEFKINRLSFLEKVINGVDRSNLSLRQEFQDMKKRMVALEKNMELDKKKYKEYYEKYKREKHGHKPKPIDLTETITCTEPQKIYKPHKVDNIEKHKNINTNKHHKKMKYKRKDK